MKEYKNKKEFMKLVDSMHEERVIEEIKEGTHLKNWNDWLTRRIGGTEDPNIVRSYMKTFLSGIEDNFTIYLKHLKSKKHD